MMAVAVGRLLGLAGSGQPEWNDVIAGKEGVIGLSISPPMVEIDHNFTIPFKLFSHLYAKYIPVPVL